MTAELTDQQQIIDVTIAYCWALDTNRWDDLDEVFLPDATALLGGTDCQGRDAIKARIERALGPLDDSQHMISNHQVVVADDGATATSRCYLQAQHVLKGTEGGPLWMVAGRYEDRFERADEGWRIRHRELVVMWTEGNPGVSRR